MSTVFEFTYRHVQRVVVYDDILTELKRMKMAVAMVQGRKKLDVSQPARDNSCTKHTWIYYHSERVRRCHDCPTAEPLWADFGLTKRTDP